MPETDLPSTIPVIEVRSLTTRIGTSEVLHDVDLVIPQGSAVGLLGCNGAGRTTLMEHLVGTLRVQCGSVRLFGLDPVSAPKCVLARVGYMPQRSILPGDYRIEELLRFSASVYENWDDSYAAHLLDKLRLDPKTEVWRLSDSARKRAQLLFALAPRPDLLVLDEPTTGLDPVERNEVFWEIMNYLAPGTTVLLSSNSAEDASRLDDRIIIMDAGRICSDCCVGDIGDEYRRWIRQLTDTVAPPSKQRGDVGPNELDSGAVPLSRKACTQADHEASTVATDQPPNVAALFKLVIKVNQRCPRRD